MAKYRDRYAQGTIIRCDVYEIVVKLFLQITLCIF